MREFTVVDKSIIDKLENLRGPSKNAEIYKMLMDGNTLSSEGDRKSVQSFYEAARKFGYKMCLRSGLIDDIPTIVFWWEKNTEGVS